MRICRHGGPSFSLDLGGLTVLVDPAFSRPGDYPPWFNEKCANLNAPTVEEFLDSHRPEYIFVTHGHFDHFDLETVRKLSSALDVTIVGSSEVVRACRKTLGLDPERLLVSPVADGPVGAEPEAGPWMGLGGGPPPRLRVRVRAVPGPHWFTGEEASAVAARFAGRPERYGAMPCGGPMLGFVFEVDGKARSQERARNEVPGEAGGPARPGAAGEVLSVYVSGDTDPGGFPEGPFDAAVVSCGGKLRNPATKEIEGPFLDEKTLAREACLTLRPRVLVPVHYDHPVFLTPFDTARLEAELAAYPDPPSLQVPAYGAWATLIP